MATEPMTDEEGIHGVRTPGHGEGRTAQALDAGFQVGFLVRFGLAIALGAAVGGAAVYALLSRDLGSYVESPTVITGVQRTVWGAAALSVLVQAVLSGVIVTSLALLASHKIVGPTVRLARLLREVCRGKLPGHVRFRRGDQAGRLETQFNEVIRLIHERHRFVRARVEGVHSAAEELHWALQKGGADVEAREAAKRLRERATELARGLAGGSGGRRE